VQAAMLACVVMGVTGCLGMDDAYDAIQWRSLMVIVGMLPFSIALESTGGVDLAADAIHALVGDAGPRPTLAALFAVTAGLGLFISNTATAIIMAPIAITLAEQLGVSPLPFAMTAALASSTAFVTPVASPVNMLVVGPGNYRFVDFLRIGGPFAIVTLVVVVLMVPWLMPF
jgi:di/tricarboxylate transporter